MYKQTTVRSGYWPIVGPVFVARAIGSIISAAVLVSFAPLVSGTPAGYGVFISAASAESVWGITVIACTSLGAGLVLRPLLRRMVGLEISLGGAVVAFLIGNIAGVTLLTLLRYESFGASTLPLLASLSPLALLGTIALEVVLVRALAEAGKAKPGKRVPATWRPPALLLLPLLLLILVLAPAVARLRSLPELLPLSNSGGARVTSADLPRVEAQMGQLLQALDRAGHRGKTVGSVTCSHTTRQPPGFGDDPVFTYYSCLAIYTNGQHNSWCAAYDGHQIGSYYEGPRGCRGPSYPS